MEREKENERERERERRVEEVQLPGNHHRNFVIIKRGKSFRIGGTGKGKLFPERMMSHSKRNPPSCPPPFPKPSTSYADPPPLNTLCPPISASNSDWFVKKVFVEYILGSGNIWSGPLMPGGPFRS
ncbi:hypothetical protein CDAR_554091 [Caerostris darwini]|uniref:Uncharacterized protein n=1 Tax=Caerostris darwini TaxID=1538125 RepID=A0AAV4X7I8_9ARAC|nr:hypothetical protein CDAR_554091 [Caerostris darwini]